MPSFAWLNNAANQLDITLAGLRDARIRCAQDDEAVLSARLDFETAKYGLMVAKQLTGSNESARELEARAKLPEQWLALLAAERAQRAGRLALALAELNREEVKLRAPPVRARRAQREGLRDYPGER